MKWRRRLKWPVTVVTVLIGLAWIDSLTMSTHISPQIGSRHAVFVGWNRSYLNLACRWRALPETIEREKPLQRRRHASRDIAVGPERLAWRPYWRSNRAFGIASLQLPMWMPTAAFLAATIYLHRTTRRIPNRCSNCRYDLTGVDEACPECGAER